MRDEQAIRDQVRAMSGFAANRRDPRAHWNDGAVYALLWVLNQGYEDDPISIRDRHPGKERVAGIFDATPREQA